MKWLPLILVFLLIVSFFFPCLSVKGQPMLVPHEDPAAAQSTLDSYSFLSQYIEVFSFMSAQNYANASQLSEKLSLITVPADLRYFANRYNNSTQQLISILSDLQSTLNRASSLLDQDRLDEVGQALEHAGFLVSQSQILLGDIKDATLTLGQRSEVLHASAESKVKQAYVQLQNILQQPNDLINTYNALLQQATERATQIKSQNLKPTSLTLFLNSTKSFVGGYASSSGVLSSKGQVLPNRAVVLLLDGNQIAVVNTRSDGSYHSVIRIPFNYVDSVSVSAIYTPVGIEKSTYLAALSPTIRVQVLFYKTTLNVSVADVAYPGLPLSINGNVTLEGGIPLDKRQISILLDDVGMDQVITNQSGLFSAKFGINSNATLGVHTLKIVAAPSGFYTGTTAQRTLTIEKIKSNVKVNIPSFVVLPSKLQVNGTVNSASNPLKGATVEIEFAKISETVRTAEDSSFNFTLDLPLTSLLAGYHDLNVKVQPNEPWQATSQTTVSVFVLNSVSIGIVLATSLVIVFGTYFKFAKSKSKKTRVIAEALPSLSSPENRVSVVVSSSPDLKLEGSKGVILKAYIEALGRVKLVTREPLMPNMTLREFRQKTSSRIGKAADPFSELTVLTERCLYSSYEPEAEDLERAKDLANEIGRILSGANE